MKVWLGALVGVLVLWQSASALPQIQSWTTAEGTRVYFAPSHELAIVDVAITLDAGSERDGALAGLSTLTHGLLDKGVAAMDADAIAASFEDVGAQYSTSVSLDRSMITLRSLSDEVLFQSAAKTLLKVIAQPSFPQGDFEREKNRLLIGIKNGEQSPAVIINQAFYAALYAGHPYAQPEQGSVESVQAIQHADIKKFYQQYFLAQTAVIAIVGDLSREQAEQLAVKISQALNDGDPIEKNRALSDSKIKSKQTHIVFPSQQAHVRIGQLGVARGDPDYFSLYVGNHVLGGGGFTSRLVEEVRSKRGLSYSVYSYFMPLQQSGPFVIGLQTRADQAQQAVQVSHDVLTKYQAEGPSVEELELSKRNIISGFPLRIDSNRDVLGYLSMIGYYQLPLSYLADFSAKIEAVSIEDIRQAFQKRVHLDSLVTIVVGNEEAAE
ncbi:MAG: pitrilysin family protein [Gammaproteobacteria bacterium]|nr:pitrilysin family protein [Gammaproteobacteria bacterium]